MRFVLIVIIGFVYTLVHVFMAMYYSAHREKYTDEQCYSLAKRAMRNLKFIGNIQTVSTGQEQLPQSGGYILYSNHLGRYDSVGIFLSHDSPCRVLMNAKKSRTFSITQMIDLLQGKRIEPNMVKQQLRVLNEITEEVKAGKRYLIFPEGKYVLGSEHKLLRFNNGCFKCAIDSHCPVVPVAIVNSDKAMNGNKLGRVVTQVHYLEPIYYEEYKDMRRDELCELVKCRIQAKLDEVLLQPDGIPVTEEESLPVIQCAK